MEPRLRDAVRARADIGHIAGARHDRSARGRLTSRGCTGKSAGGPCSLPLPGRRGHRRSRPGDQPFLPGPPTLRDAPDGADRLVALRTIIGGQRSRSRRRVRPRASPAVGKPACRKCVRLGGSSGQAPHPSGWRCVGPTAQAGLTARAGLMSFRMRRRRPLPATALRESSD